MTAKIIVEGFKSIRERAEVEVRPLTILAGANSSGKSSLMHALLLLKQTLEANYDPGPLLLSGPNVRFTSADQLLHAEAGVERANGFTVGLELDDQFTFETRLERAASRGDLEVVRCRVRTKQFPERVFTPDTDLSDLRVLQGLPVFFTRQEGAHPRLELKRERFWLLPTAVVEVKDGPDIRQFRLAAFPIDLDVIREIIHIPGLRGNPERTYPLTSTGPRFSGTFESYTASVIHRWTTTPNKAKLKELGRQLKRLGLTWKVESRKVDDTTIELRVGRLAEPVKHGARDTVNIADVGFGVSQALPVVVALLEARPGQLVYVEQPEIHLHPKAQVAMAGLLADAAKRGVLVVSETHSSLLLLGVQTLIAQGRLAANLVKLHWFERDRTTGATKITSGELDEAGRFRDWPEDFDEVTLEAQSTYLDAVDALLVKE